MTDMIIETPIDQLAKLISERKKIPLGEAAKILKTNETQVEGWVRILEENGFVELVYPALGEPQIVLKSLEKRDLSKKKKEFENRKDVVEEKTKEFEKRVDILEKKVELSNKEFNQLDSELKNKLTGLEKNLKIIDELQSKRGEIIKKAEEMRTVTNSVNDAVENIKSEINQMESKINEHIKAIEGHDADIKNLDENKKTIENEIMNLEREMQLIKLLVNKPVTVPMSGLKSIFSRHREKTEEIKEKKDKLHEKALKMKSVVSEKKEHVQSKENDHKKFFRFLKR